ncbi:S24 family peptidase [Oceanospirillum sp. HFRX-1_2]
MRLRPIGPILDRLRGDLSQRDIVNRIGDASISAGTLSRLFRSDKNRCRLETLDQVSSALNIPLSEIIKEAETGSEELEPARDDIGFRICPVISNVQAGDFAESLIVPPDQNEWVPLPQKAGAYCFALRVTGESMVSSRGEKSFYPGDVIIVDPTRRQPTEGEFVVAHVSGSNKFTFKKYSTDNGEVVLIPLNPQYPTIFPQEETTIVGTVITKCEPEFIIRT